ncbi:hypothetical protein CIPAW_08G110100 [Carya illinoinensis]|uniref:Uncharacterized protein n=1 Tax=Carya illinoinensis TaxID=32201 RepID=A0A8T1PWN4_CARIL|nr:hypothetical protein CIPAW_08G110100 [Carya illinoinensis]
MENGQSWRALQPPFRIWARDKSHMAGLCSVLDACSLTLLTEQKMTILSFRVAPLWWMLFEVFIKFGNEWKKKSSFGQLPHNQKYIYIYSTLPNSPIVNLLSEKINSEYPFFFHLVVVV